MARNFNVNYFVIINSFKQMRYVEYLINREFDSEVDKNIILYRKEIGNYKKSLFIENNCNVKGAKIYPIPFIRNAKKYKVCHHVNNIIYLVYFAVIFARHFTRNSNVIFGNAYLVSNRIIANLFSKMIANIYLIDEGTSTLDVFEKRNRFLSGSDKVRFNEFPRRPLKIVTSFRLKSNGFDQIIETKIFNRCRQNKINSNTVIFIGTYLVEAKYISIDDLRKMIQLLIENYSDKDIVYIVHPKESVIFQLFENEYSEKIKILKLSSSIEEYFVNMEIPPYLICSTFSTAFYNSIDIFEGDVSYAVFQFTFDSVTDSKKHQLTTIYNQLNAKLSIFNYRLIIVN